MLNKNRRAHVNLAMLEFMVKKLGTLKDDFVFLGGCATANLAPSQHSESEWTAQMERVLEEIGNEAIAPDTGQREFFVQSKKKAVLITKGGVFPRKIPIPLLCFFFHIV